MSILKAIKSYDNNLIITLYVYDDMIDEIRVWNYNVKSRSIESGDSRFESYYIKNNDGISTVFLKGIKNSQLQMDTEQILSDQILYMFKDIFKFPCLLRAVATHVSSFKSLLFLTCFPIILILYVD